MKNQNVIYVVHQGLRDDYQVAQSLSKLVGYKVVLVTSGYPSGLSEFIFKLLPGKYARKFLNRSRDSLKNLNIFSVLANEILSKFFAVTFGEGFGLDYLDKCLYRKFFKIYDPSNCAAILCYNYNAYRIFSDNRIGDVPKLLFMCHPHPLFCKEILGFYISKNIIPSGIKEKEFSYSSEYMARLISEPLIADSIVCASSFTRDSIRRYNSELVNIEVIPYGVSDNFKNKKNYCVEAKKNIKIIYVGQFSYRKGVSLLVKILNMCKSSVDLTVIGRGIREYNINLDKLNDRHSITVKWDISDADLRACYADADVFLFPTLLEGFGLVVLEAMLSGCIPIVSRNSCAPDIIRSGIDGFSFDPLEFSAFANSIDMLAQDSEKIISYKNSAIDRARHFTWDMFGEKMRNYVESEIEKHRGVTNV